MLDREKLAESILTFIPMLHRKLMKVYPTHEVSRQQLGLLFKINCNDRKPMSYYSEQMSIPKSNLTVLSDKLIDEGLIERIFDPNDRRVVILGITEKGTEYLCQYKAELRQEMIKMLGSFSDRDITRLNELVEEIKTIIGKKGL